MTPADRIRRLVHEGAVAPDEGERLLAAIGREPDRSRFWIVFNPFDRFGGGVAAVAGLVVSGLSVLVTRLGVRFDGFLDLHVSRHRIPTLGLSILEQLIVWIVPAICFWSFARLTARHVRLVDFVGMVGLARLPMLLCAVPLALLSPAALDMPPKPTPALLGVAVISLVCVAWFITLLYQGFKNASGLRGPKLVGGFIAMIVVAEIITKLLIVSFL